MAGWQERAAIHFRGTSEVAAQAEPGVGGEDVALELHQKLARRLANPHDVPHDAVGRGLKDELGLRALALRAERYAGLGPQGSCRRSVDVEAGASAHSGVVELRS